MAWNGLTCFFICSSIFRIQLSLSNMSSPWEGFLPSRHTTSFQRRYDVVRHCTTSYWRWNDIECLLGNHYTLASRSSRPHMIFKVGVLKTFAICTRKHLCWSLFLNIVTGFQAFTKKRIQQRCFPVKFKKLLRIAFFDRTKKDPNWDTFRTLWKIFGGAFSRE